MQEGTIMFDRNKQFEKVHNKIGLTSPTIHTMEMKSVSEVNDRIKI